jgi:hypothetical protein
MHDSRALSQKIIQQGALFAHFYSSELVAVTIISEFRSKFPYIFLTDPPFWPTNGREQVGIRRPETLLPGEGWAFRQRTSADHRLAHAEEPRINQ